MLWKYAKKIYENWKSGTQTSTSVDELDCENVKPENIKKVMSETNKTNKIFAGRRSIVPTKSHEYSFNCRMDTYGDDIGNSKDSLSCAELKTSFAVTLHIYNDEHKKNLSESYDTNITIRDKYMYDNNSRVKYYYNTIYNVKNHDKTTIEIDFNTEANKTMLLDFEKSQNIYVFREQLISSIILTAKKIFSVRCCIYYYSNQTNHWKIFTDEALLELYIYKLSGFKIIRILNLNNKNILKHDYSLRIGEFIDQTDEHCNSKRCSLDDEENSSPSLNLQLNYRAPPTYIWAPINDDCNITVKSLNNIIIRAPYYAENSVYCIYKDFSFSIDPKLDRAEIIKIFAQCINSNTTLKTKYNF